MNNNTNPILKAMLSKLVSQRDEAMLRLDLIINKNISDAGPAGMVEEAVEISKKISESEIAIDWVSNLVKNNDNTTQIIDKIKEMQKTVQENSNNNNNDGDNS